MASLLAGERYEFTAGRSDKFWEWRLFESSDGGMTPTTYELRFTWGRRGTVGQSQSEWFTTRDLAYWKARVRSNGKTDKGYRLASGAIPAVRGLTTSFVVKARAADAAGRANPFRKPSAKKERDEPPPIVSTRRVRLRD